MAFDAAENIGRLASGSFLVAREVLRDPNFEGTVVLLCAHDAEGDYGLVLNRPAVMPLSEVFESLPPALRGPCEVGIGGPVEQEKIQILDWSGDPAPESQQIVPGLVMGGHWDFTWTEGRPPDATTRDGKPFHLATPDSYRIFLGYSGWGHNQLRDEIEFGAWRVFEADVVEALRLGPLDIPLTEDDFARWAAAHPPSTETRR